MAKPDIKTGSDTVILGGIISVKAAIDGGYRTIECVYADLEKYKKRDRKITQFVSMLKSKGIKYELCPRNMIDALAMDHVESCGNTHGGVIAFAGQRNYSDIDALLDKCVKEKGYLVYLDGVEDPFNFGYSLRSLHAFGVSGVIVPPRNWSSAAGVCARASAGASELVDIACTKDLSQSKQRLEFLSEIKAKGITVGCAAVSSKSVSVTEYEFPMPFLLFIGGEKRGISPEFADNADVLVHIPYANPDVRYSLPTAEAAAIFGLRMSSFINNYRGIYK